VDELLKDFGADICRWWVSSLAYENDIKVDLSFFKLSADSYRKVRNVLRFLLSNLADFDPKTDMVDPGKFDPAGLDALTLHRAAEMEKTVKAAYAAYDLRKGHLAMFDFINEDLSAQYCAAM
jgi:isoleucyl-tRNA synthetase